MDKDAGLAMFMDFVAHMRAETAALNAARADGQREMVVHHGETFVLLSISCCWYFQLERRLCVCYCDLFSMHSSACTRDSLHDFVSSQLLLYIYIYISSKSK
jgi:hypothetical protein